MTASKELTQLARSIAMECVDSMPILGKGAPYTLGTIERIALRHLLQAFTANPFAKAARQAAPRRSGPVRNLSVKDANTGNPIIYPSATEAARALYVSPSSVANHLNNPERVPTVAGCKLERVKL